MSARSFRVLMLADFAVLWRASQALKFVTFPTQVIFKSSKMIPVMIMGKIIDKRVYTATDYALAITISIGVVRGVCAQAAVDLKLPKHFHFSHLAFPSVFRCSLSVTGWLLLLCFD